MLEQPFSILLPFADRMHVSILTREDGITSDAAAGKRLGIARTAGLHQMHGNRTVRVEGPMERTEQADGMVTSVRGILLLTRWADCQNFIIYEPQNNILGVLHLGWRCLIAGAIPELFRTLEQEFGVHPSDVWVGAGPSLCRGCADFTDPPRELPNIDHRFFHGKTVDLRAAADEQFFSLGVLPERFERHADCTRCMPEMYWTYRGGHREAVQAGCTNMLACVLL